MIIKVEITDWPALGMEATSLRSAAEQDSADSPAEGNAKKKKNASGGKRFLLKPFFIYQSNRARVS